MATLFLRQALLRRVCFHNYKRFTAGAAATRHRLWCSAASSLSSDEAEKKTNTGGISNSSFARKAQYPPSSEARKWKDQEEEILSDIEPIVVLAKDIIHSGRYIDGARLSEEDEKSIAEKLLAYHPHSEDKIGCGLESIMEIPCPTTFKLTGNKLSILKRNKGIKARVDRHPQYRQSRCLFVVRTDGGWIDFSYQKCLREYIRYKYPTHAERFIREHFKRGKTIL